MLRSVAETLKKPTKSVGSEKRKQPLGRCFIVTSSEVSKRTTLTEEITVLCLTARKYHLLPPLLDVEPADWIPKLVQHLPSFSLLQINTVSYRPLKT